MTFGAGTYEVCNEVQCKVMVSDAAKRCDLKK